MKKLVRITTVPISLEKLLENQLSFMSDYFEVIAVSSDIERLYKFGVENKVKTKHIELTRQITPIKDLIALWKMYWFLKKEKPSIVHSHTPKAGIIGMLGAKLAGVPIRLHTVAGLPLMETQGNKRRLLEFVEKLTYWSASHVFPNSKGLYDFILQNKFTTKEKLSVIGNGSSNGINVNHFSPDSVPEEEKLKIKEELQIGHDDFVFVFVGRLVGDKGINELVDAYSQILELGYSNSKLLLVGDFEQELDPLKTKTIKRIKENKHILSVGFKSDVRPYFAISDCLVFPSYREGFPNVVMQAGAMGLPAIVSDINGCNEIIVQDINGRIVPAKNVELLKREMLYLLGNKSVMMVMKSNSRGRIVGDFNQNVIWKELLAYYNNEIKSKV